MNRPTFATTARPDVPHVLYAGRLVDGTGAPPVDDAAVVVRDGRIVEVTTIDAWRRAGDPNLSVRDHSEATLAPGLIDGHVHLVLTAADTTEQLLSDFYSATPHDFALLAAEHARLCLLGGVTTVRDCGGTGTVIQRLRDLIRDGWLVGPRILSSGMPITTRRGHGHFFGLTADTLDEVRDALAHMLAAGPDSVDVVKVMATGGRITPGSDISKMQYGLEALTLIAETAHAADRRVAAHVLTTEGITTCVHAGIDTLEHCRFQDPDGAYRYDEAVLARMAAQGTYVSLTMAGNMRDAMLAKRADPAGYTPSVVDAGRFRTEADMVGRGLRTFVTSDAGVTRARFEEFPLSVACMTHLLGVDPVAAIAHATGRAAEALGIEADTGTVAPGKAADLIVVDGDPTRDIDDLMRIRSVYRGGRAVVRDGAVATAADARKE